MTFGIQLIVIFFALVMAYLSYTHYKRRELNGRELALWLLFWAGFIAVTIFPHSVDFLVHTFRLNRVMDLVMIIGFLILLGLTFRNFVFLKKVSRKLEQLVRSEALRDLDKDNPS